MPSSLTRSLSGPRTETTAGSDGQQQQQQQHGGMVPMVPPVVGVGMEEMGVGSQSGTANGQSQANDMPVLDAECREELGANGTGEETETETDTDNRMLDISDLCPGSPSEHVDLAAAGLLATSAEGDGSILGNDDTCHSTQMLQSEYVPLSPPMSMATQTAPPPPLLALPPPPPPPPAAAAAVPVTGIAAALSPSAASATPLASAQTSPPRLPPSLHQMQMPHQQPLQLTTNQQPPPQQQQQQQQHSDIQQQLLHQPVLSAEWTAEDQRLLEEALISYPCDKFSGLVRYLRVAATIPSKTARDVALRIQWMAKRDMSKKRKAEQENLSKKSSKDKKDKVEVSKPSLGVVTGRPLMTNLCNPSGVSSSDMEESGSPLDNEEDTTAKLLEENNQAIQQVTLNLNNCKLQENTELLVKVRDNILSILKGLKGVPGIMNEMPPLPVKLNLELANTILPRPAHLPPPPT